MIWLFLHAWLSLQTFFAKIKSTEKKKDFLWPRKNGSGRRREIFENRTIVLSSLCIIHWQWKSSPKKCLFYMMLSSCNYNLRERKQKQNKRKQNDACNDGCSSWIELLQKANNNSDLVFSLDSQWEREPNKTHWLS